MNEFNPRRACVYVGLGSNLNDPIAQLRAARGALSMLPSTRLEKCSSFYRTAPVGYTEQPDFLNAVCRLNTGLAAAALIEHLRAIEVRYGRVECEQKWGPRTIDLDLLLYDQSVMNASGLTVPHPRLHERAFVLYPLSELDRDLVVPGRGAVGDLLAACHGQRIEKLSESTVWSKV